MVIFSDKNGISVTFIEANIGAHLDYGPCFYIYSRCENGMHNPLYVGSAERLADQIEEDKKNGVYERVSKMSPTHVLFNVPSAPTMDDACRASRRRADEFISVLNPPCN